MTNAAISSPSAVRKGIDRGHSNQTPEEERTSKGATTTPVQRVYRGLDRYALSAVRRRPMAPGAGDSRGLCSRYAVQRRHAAGAARGSQQDSVPHVLRVHSPPSRPLEDRSPQDPQAVVDQLAYMPPPMSGRFAIIEASRFSLTAWTMSGMAPRP